MLPSFPRAQAAAAAAIAPVNAKGAFCEEKISTLLREHRLGKCF